MQQLLHENMKCYFLKISCCIHIETNNTEYPATLKKKNQNHLTFSKTPKTNVYNINTAFTTKNERWVNSWSQIIADKKFENIVITLTIPLPYEHVINYSCVWIFKTFQNPTKISRVELLLFNCKFFSWNIEQPHFWNKIMD